jgi:uncharacterized cupin superfamily protein
VTLGPGRGTKALAALSRAHSHKERGTGNVHPAPLAGDGRAVFLEIGDRRDDDEALYSDIDMELRVVLGRNVHVHRSGEPWEP